MRPAARKRSWWGASLAGSRMGSRDHGLRRARRAGRAGGRWHILYEEFARLASD